MILLGLIALILQPEFVANFDLDRNIYSLTSPRAHCFGVSSPQVETCSCVAIVLSDNITTVKPSLWLNPWFERLRDCSNHSLIWYVSSLANFQEYRRYATIQGDCWEVKRIDNVTASPYFFPTSITCVEVPNEIRFLTSVTSRDQSSWISNLLIALILLSILLILLWDLIDVVILREKGVDLSLYFNPQYLLAAAFDTSGLTTGFELSAATKSEHEYCISEVEPASTNTSMSNVFDNTVPPNSPVRVSQNQSDSSSSVWSSSKKTSSASSATRSGFGLQSISEDDSSSSPNWRRIPIGFEERRAQSSVVYVEGSDSDNDQDEIDAVSELLWGLDIQLVSHTDSFDDSDAASQPSQRKHLPRNQLPPRPPPFNSTLSNSNSTCSSSSAVSAVTAHQSIIKIQSVHLDNLRSFLTLQSLAAAEHIPSLSLLSQVGPCLSNYFSRVAREHRWIRVFTYSSLQRPRFARLMVVMGDIMSICLSSIIITITLFSSLYSEAIDRCNRETIASRCNAIYESDSVLISMGRMLSGEMSSCQWDSHSSKCTPSYYPTSPAAFLASYLLLSCIISLLACPIRVLLSASFELLYDTSPDLCDLAAIKAFYRSMSRSLLPRITWTRWAHINTLSGGMEMEMKSSSPKPMGQRISQAFLSSLPRVNVLRFAFCDFVSLQDETRVVLTACQDYFLSGLRKYPLDWKDAPMNKDEARNFQTRSDAMRNLINVSGLHSLWTSSCIDWIACRISSSRDNSSRTIEVIEKIMSRDATYRPVQEKDTPEGNNSIPAGVKSLPSLKTELLLIQSAILDHFSSINYRSSQYNILSARLKHISVFRTLFSFDSFPTTRISTFRWLTLASVVLLEFSLGASLIAALYSSIRSRDELVNLSASLAAFTLGLEFIHQYFYILLLDSIALQSARNQLFDIYHVYSNMIKTLEDHSLGRAACFHANIRVVQHLLPSCRAARMSCCANMTSSNMLLSLDDEDFYHCHIHADDPVPALLIVIFSIPLLLMDVVDQILPAYSGLFSTPYHFTMCSWRATLLEAFTLIVISIFLTINVILCIVHPLLYVVIVALVVLGSVVCAYWIPLVNRFSTFFFKGKISASTTTSQWRNMNMLPGDTKSSGVSTMSYSNATHSDAITANLIRRPRDTLQSIDSFSTEDNDVHSVSIPEEIFDMCLYAQYFSYTKIDHDPLNSIARKEQSSRRIHRLSTERNVRVTDSLEVSVIRTKRLFKNMSSGNIGTVILDAIDDTPPESISGIPFLPSHSQSHPILVQNITSISMKGEPLAKRIFFLLDAESVVEVTEAALALYYPEGVPLSELEISYIFDKLHIYIDDRGIDLRRYHQVTTFEIISPPQSNPLFDSMGRLLCIEMYHYLEWYHRTITEVISFRHLESPRLTTSENIFTMALERAFRKDTHKRLVQMRTLEHPNHRTDVPRTHHFASSDVAFFRSALSSEESPMSSIALSRSSTSASDHGGIVRVKYKLTPRNSSHTSSHIYKSSSKSSSGSFSQDDAMGSPWMKAERRAVIEPDATKSAAEGRIIIGAPGTFTHNEKRSPEKRQVSPDKPTVEGRYHFPRFDRLDPLRFGSADSLNSRDSQQY